MPVWPLRSALILAMGALVVVSVVFYQLQRDSGAATTTTRATTTTSTTRPSGGTPTTTGVTTTTLRQGGTGIPPTPVTAQGGPTTPSRGCNFAMSPPKGSSTPTPTRAIGHCTVLEIGDSLGNDLGWGLARVLTDNPGLHLIQMDRSDTGLVKTGYYNWFTALPQFLHEYHPNMVIVCIGGNDEQTIQEQGRDIDFGSPAWAKAYESRVKQIADIAHRAGALVLWVGLPIMQPYYYREGMLTINAQFLKGATSVPGGTFVPTWDLFATANGQFRASARVNHVPQTLRSPDGIHFSYVGEQVIATYVAHAIEAIYHVHLRLTGAAVIDG